MCHFSKMCIAVTFGLGFNASVLAAEPATPPNAGLIYQQNQPKLTAPVTSSLQLNMASPSLKNMAEGGPKVSINSISFEGNHTITSEALLSALGDYQAQQYDLAGLTHLANHLSAYYRQRGYLFATAIIPAQTLADGQLQIQIVEGDFGQVTVKSDDADIQSTLANYLTSLKSGEVIESSALSRQLLLIDDLPGVTSSSVLRPGEQVGTGDLVVTAEHGKTFSGYVSADNHGSRYSGEYRPQAGVSINQLFTVGDELNLSASYSTEDTWLGGIAYSLPLGGSGLRGNLSYSHSDYQLGHGFQGYTGTAEVSSIGVSYPLIRSQSTNVRVSGAYQYKNLDDEVEMFEYLRTTHSQTIPLSLSFDHRDGLLGGGVSWGQVTMTLGKSDVNQSDTADVDRKFSLWNLQLFRQQNIGAGFSAYVHASGQWSNRKVLDGSESFYLGGPNGVRAYPVGEGSDSRGWLAQAEVRYHKLPYGIQPYAFFDAGYTPNGGVDEGDKRQLSGAGLGVRASYASFNLDAAIAWKLHGGDALSDSKQRDPQIWFTAGYRF